MKTKPDSTGKPSKHEAMGQPGNITLSERDYVRVVAALADPAPPTPALMRAMREYESQREADPKGNR